MSINQFSSDLPEPLWRTTQQQPLMEQTSRAPSNSIFWANPQFYHHPTASTSSSSSSMFCSQNQASFSFNLNSHEDEEAMQEQLTDERQNEAFKEQEFQNQVQETIPKEPMFEKPLTPSDVGKLNRLVIPKQYAEKYFPLGGGGGGVGSGGGDSGCCGGEKGLLLGFEDESGKSWRFRYSYWNSSQSYVLTKGWSRFVKEKRLDAGDVVLFERHRVDGDRFFIGWRRRTSNSTTAPAQENKVSSQKAAKGSGGKGGGDGWTRAFSSAHAYPSQHPNGPHLPYQPDCLHAGSAVQNQMAPSGNSKRSLRLFGVNLDCEPDICESEPPTPDGSSMSSHDQAHHRYHQHHHHYSQAYASNHQNHMDNNFSRDLNQMRYRRG